MDITVILCTLQPLSESCEFAGEPCSYRGTRICQLGSPGGRQFSFFRLRYSQPLPTQLHSDLPGDPIIWTMLPFEFRLAGN